MQNAAWRNIEAARVPNVGGFGPLSPQPGIHVSRLIEKTA